MKIWVDADAAPRDVKDVVFRAAKRLEVQTFLVANHRLRPPADNPFVEFVWVPDGPDVADHHIVENSEAGDLAITADTPAALIDRGATSRELPQPKLLSATIKSPRTILFTNSGSASSMQ